MYINQNIDDDNTTLSVIFYGYLRVLSKILQLPSRQELPLSNRSYYFSYIIFLVPIRLPSFRFTPVRFDSASDSRLATQCCNV